MFELWCEACQQPRKCRNNDGALYCIACRAYLGRQDVVTRAELMQAA